MNIDITNYLRINPVDMALVCISTLIICLVAKHFFWDVITDYFQKRHDAIAADIQAGSDARKAGEDYKVQYETQMANAMLMRSWKPQNAMRRLRRKKFLQKPEMKRMD